ncbi:hypothetical protein M6I34_06015 [Burkholderiaceae bacterium FT117]|uniref:hypothetical protein n=1 Tax=Zeimonas sediminis TaxID=2944268 RepID=UPI0023430E4D|nr:hypothetical protein [Zeimonas sediminis]MCM5570057.1 hypothetical protein [Zeimonas sediminis]
MSRTHGLPVVDPRRGTPGHRVDDAARPPSPFAPRRRQILAAAPGAPRHEPSSADKPAPPHQRRRNLATLRLLAEQAKHREAALAALTTAEADVFARLLRHGPSSLRRVVRNVRAVRDASHAAELLRRLVELGLALREEDTRPGRGRRARSLFRASTEIGSHGSKAWTSPN